MPRSGTGRVFQRGGTWWIQYGHNGEDIRESAKSTKKKDAVALLRQRLHEMGSGRFVGPRGERVTFADLAQLIDQDYILNQRKSIRRLRTSLDRLREVFGTDRAIDITTSRVKAYIVARRELGIANATITAELAALKRAFTLALQDGLLANRPHIPSLRVQNARQGFFTDGSLDALLAQLPAYLRAPTRFAYLTGRRKAEVLSREWSHVDFDTGEIRLWTSKNDEPRVFPFAVLPPLRDLLEEQREHTRTIERRDGRIIPWVFHRDGQRIRSLKNAWIAAREAAGLDGWLFHDLRRSAVRNLEAAGVSRSVAMKLTGHKTEAVYRRYAIADAASLREGVEKLARHQATGRKVIPIDTARSG